MDHFLCSFMKSTKYLILKASKASYMKYKTIPKQKGPPFNLFWHLRLSSLFRLCETSFKNSLMSPKVFWSDKSTFQIFVVLQQKGMFEKPKGSPFTFFGTMRLFKTFNFRLILVFIINIYLPIFFLQYYRNFRRNV